MLQNNSLQLTWPHLKLPPTNCFFNTTDLMPSLNTNFPFQLLLNNQNRTFLRYSNPRHTLSYKINQTNETPIGQTNLIEIHSLSNFKPINIPYKQIKFNKPYLQIDFKEITAIIDIASNLNLPPTSSPQQPSICIFPREIQLIHHIVKTPYYQNQLTQIYNNIINLNITRFRFYTDASIKNLQTPNLQSSIGWICENDLSIKFNAAIHPSPDSSRSELAAIISLLLVLPINSTITILIDNLIAINNLLNLSPSKLIQNKNWDIITIINSIKLTKNISIIPTKVKSHSNSSIHNQADLLAKQGSNKPILEISYIYFNLPTYFLWNNHTITFKICSFIKNTITIQDLISWSSLKFFDNYAPDINWNLTFKIINSLEYDSSKYSFYIKILTNNLPTMQNLNIRYPSLYTTNKCCKCSLIEDTLHILLCSKNTETIQQSLINITNNTLHQLQLNIPSTILLNSLLLITTNSPNIQPDLLLPTILGIFSKSIYQNIKTLLNKQTELFLINFSNNLLN